MRLLPRCTLYTDSDVPSGPATRFEVVERVSHRALLLLGAGRAIVWPVEEYRKLCKQVKEPKNLAALLIPHDELYAGQWFAESSVSWEKGGKGHENYRRRRAHV